MEMLWLENSAETFISTASHIFSIIEQEDETFFPEICCSFLLSWVKFIKLIFNHFVLRRNSLNNEKTSEKVSVEVSMGKSFSI
jgi:hypothetical protein